MLISQVLKPLIGRIFLLVCEAYGMSIGPKLETHEKFSILPRGEQQEAKRAFTSSVLAEARWWEEKLSRHRLWWHTLMEA